MNNIDAGDASLDALAILQAQLSARSIAVVAVESTVFLLLDLAAFVGNAVVCFIMYRNQQLRTPNNLYILSLAITDLMMAVLVLPLTVGAHINSGWLFGSVMCRVQGYLLTVLLQISIYTMALTAVNRYLCIVHSNLYRVYFTKRRTLASIVIVWVVTFVINALPDVLSLNDNTFFCPGYVLCWKRVSNPIAIYIMFVWLYLTFALSYTVIVVCYYRVFKAVIHHKKAVAPSLSQPQQQDQQQQRSHSNPGNVKEVNMATTLSVLVLAFTICWLPSGIMDSIDKMDPMLLPREIFLVASFLWFLSSAANPVIYGAMNKTLKKEYRLLWNSLTGGSIVEPAPVPLRGRLMDGGM